MMQNFLKRSIPSVLNQALKPLEIIVIDDGSDNNDAEKIVNAFSLHSDISILYKKKKNGGPSSARNKGISLAKGGIDTFY